MFFSPPGENHLITVVKNQRGLSVTSKALSWRFYRTSSYLDVNAVSVNQIGVWTQSCLYCGR